MGFKPSGKRQSGHVGRVRGPPTGCSGCNGKPSRDGEGIETEEMNHAFIGIMTAPSGRIISGWQLPLPKALSIIAM